MVLPIILFTLPCWNHIIIIEINVGTVSEILQGLRQLAPRQVGALDLVDFIRRVGFIILIFVEQFLQGLGWLRILIEANFRDWI